MLESEKKTTSLEDYHLNGKWEIFQSNPHVVNDMPMDSLKLTVWCIVNTDGIIIFFFSFKMNKVLLLLLKTDAIQRHGLKFCFHE